MGCGIIILKYGYGYGLSVKLFAHIFGTLLLISFLSRFQKKPFKPEPNLNGLCCGVALHATVLESFNGLLEKLQSSSFRNRRVSLDSVIRDDLDLFHQLLPASSEMLGVLSLGCEEKDGKFNPCLVSDPVKTSLALPVALDDAIANLKESKMDRSIRSNC